MVTDAEAHAEEDRKRREEIEVKNRGDALAYETGEEPERAGREDGRRVEGARRERARDAEEGRRA